MIKKFIPILIVIILGILDFVLIGFAWQNPTQAPPGGNLAEPLNVSSITQTKAGSLNIMGNVGIGTTNPHSSAILDLTSTSTGFLLPRMTSDQRNAISSPATGLLVFNTTDTKINVWDGTEWGEVGGVGWALNGNDLYNTNSGNVGIGTTSPQTKLDINGPIRIANTSATCDSSNSGTFRWTGNSLEFCNGLSWRMLSGLQDGSSQQRAAKDCEEILANGYSTGDGVYWIDPDGGSTGNAFRVYCKMTMAGGGWTLLDNFVSSLAGDSDPYGFAVGYSNIKNSAGLTNAGYTTYLTNIENTSYTRVNGYLQMFYGSTPAGYIEKVLPSWASEVYVKWGNWSTTVDYLKIGGSTVQTLSANYGAATYQGTYAAGNKIRFEESSGGIFWVGEIWVR